MEGGGGGYIRNTLAVISMLKCWFSALENTLRWCTFGSHERRVLYWLSGTLFPNCMCLPPYSPNQLCLNVCWIGYGYGGTLRSMCARRRLLCFFAATDVAENARANSRANGWRGRDIEFIEVGEGEE